MWSFPDLTLLFWLAVIGLVSVAIVVIGGGGWVAYHLYHAITLYVGAA